MRDLTEPYDPNPQALDVPKRSQTREILVERYHGKDPGKDVNVGNGSSLGGSCLAQPYKVGAKDAGCYHSHNAYHMQKAEEGPFVGDLAVV